MTSKRQHEFDLAGRVSFRIPAAVHQAIQARASIENKTISDIMREETMHRFKPNNEQKVS